MENVYGALSSLLLGLIKDLLDVLDGLCHMLWHFVVLIPELDLLQH